MQLACRLRRSILYCRHDLTKRGQGFPQVSDVGHGNGDKHRMKSCCEFVVVAYIVLFIEGVMEYIQRARRIESEQGEGFTASLVRGVMIMFSVPTVR